MTLSADVYTVCAADATLTALVSDRIYFARQVTSTFPQVVYSSAGYGDEMYRDQDDPPSRAEVIMQFDCYGSTANEAEEVADAIVSLWSGLQQTSPDIGRAQVSNRINDGYNASLEAFRQIVDVVIDVSV
jgi:hypothetical protein